MTTRMLSRASHLGWLDAVRGIAAGYVVLHHAVTNIDSLLPPDALSRFLNVLFSNGHAAVDVFIVLSGFCLMLPLARAESFPPMATFIARRSVRLLLPYYAAMALSLLAIWLWIGSPSGTHWDYALPVRGKDIASHLLLVQQLGDTTSARINHTFWSIGVEYQIYFLFPLLFLGFRRWGIWLTTVLAIDAGYAAWGVSLWAGWPNPSAFGASFYYLGLFCMGAAASQWASGQVVRVSGKPDRTAQALRWTAALTLSLLLVMLAQHQQLLHKTQVASLMIGASAAAVLALRTRVAAPDLSRDMVRRSPMMRAAGSALSRLGVIGFSLYLLHAPVLEIVWRVAVRPMHLASAGAEIMMMIVIGLPVSMAVAAVFYRLVELPCHRWSRSIGKLRISTAEPVPLAAA